MKETAEWQFSKIEKQHGLVADEGTVEPVCYLNEGTTASLIKKLGIQVVSGVLLSFLAKLSYLCFFPKRN